jgi:hypothetical protein
MPYWQHLLFKLDFSSDFLYIGSYHTARMALWKGCSLAAYLRKRGCTKKVQPRFILSVSFPSVNPAL